MTSAIQLTRVLKLPDAIASEPFVGKWKGPLSHVGPDRFTPLKEALCDKTNAALYSMMSGTLLWAAARLEHKTDVVPLQDMALALFCYQQDARYFCRPTKIASISQIEESDQFRATALYLLDLIYQDHIYGSKKWPPEPMFGTIAAMINLTRFSMSQSGGKAFDDWVRAMIDRLNKIAAFDEQGETPDFGPDDDKERAAWALKVMGMPLPPSVLDLSVDPDLGNFSAEWHDFLTSIDWKRSKHLQSPDTLRAAGFIGNPYESSR